MTIPVEVAEITPGWLSDVLDTEVTGIEVLEAHSGTTGRARIGLTYADDAGDRPSSVFVKLAPFDPRQRTFVDLVGLGTAEARFYRDVAGEVPVRVPAVHHASVDDQAEDGGGRYVMVLEDLVASGCRLPSPSDADVADSVAAIVDALARLHAAYWESPRLQDDLAWVATGGRVAFEGGGSFIAKALEKFGDEMGPSFRRLAEIYVARTPEVAAVLASGPPTLIHGDPHLGNLFLDGATAGFFDWGMVWRATGVRDFAYVLGNSTPTEVRRARERDWLQHYLAVLRAAGIELDESTAWDQYRVLVIYAWASATSTAAMGSRWQAVEVGEGGMGRATAAVEDLESVDLLESLL
jgi:Ser/Thr protein kinase RdoA (MazF antagonist)